MMEALAAYTEEEFNRYLVSRIKAMTMPASLAPSGTPSAVLLGGQSGAGKTTLHRICAAAFAGNVIVINGDEYRSGHPRFHELQESYGDAAVEHTVAWAGRMTEALIDCLSRLGYNLVIEGTLRTSEVPMATAKLLRERGYGVSLALMAVKPEISLVSCQLRYEQMRIAGTVPRATDPAHHRMIVDQIVKNLATLEGSGSFDGIALYSRKGERLYPAEGDCGAASEALERVLLGPWTAEEEAHLAYLEARLSQLREQ